MTRPLSRQQALVLGAVAIVAIVAGAWRLMTLPQNSAWGSDVISVTAPFRDVAGLRVGTRVHLQGVDVGEVSAVDLPDVGGGAVNVKLRLAGALKTRLGTDTRVNISRDNPLADRIVRLEPGSASSPRLTDGAALSGIETPDLFDSLAQSTAKLNSVLGELNDSLQSKKGTLGKLLHDEKLYNDLSTAAAELKEIAYEIRKGEGSIGAFIKDRAVFEKTLEAIDDVRAMVASVRQNSDAVKALPVVRSYVVDPHKELVRPDMKRLRKVYADDELFEKGRAVLTDQGKEKLDGAAEWLKGYKSGEVMIASMAAPSSNSSFAQTLTTKQAEAVREYLVSKDVHRIGWWWWSTRPVRSIGCGNQVPSQPEAETLPAGRVEVILFLPEK